MQALKMTEDGRIRRRFIPLCINKISYQSLNRKKDSQYKSFINSPSQLKNVEETQNSNLEIKNELKNEDSSEMSFKRNNIFIKRKFPINSINSRKHKRIQDKLSINSENSNHISELILNSPENIQDHFIQYRDDSSNLNINFINKQHEKKTMEENQQMIFDDSIYDFNEKFLNDDHLFLNQEEIINQIFSGIDEERENKTQKLKGNETENMELHNSSIKAILKSNNIIKHNNFLNLNSVRNIENDYKKITRRNKIEMLSPLNHNDQKGENNNYKRIVKLKKSHNFKSNIAFRESAYSKNFSVEDNENYIINPKQFNDKMHRLKNDSINVKNKKLNISEVRILHQKKPNIEFNLKFDQKIKHHNIISDPILNNLNDDYWNDSDLNGHYINFQNIQLSNENYNKESSDWQANGIYDSDRKKINFNSPHNILNINSHIKNKLYPIKNHGVLVNKINLSNNDNRMAFPYEAKKARRDSILEDSFIKNIHNLNKNFSPGMALRRKYSREKEMFRLVKLENHDRFKPIRKKIISYDEKIYNDSNVRVADQYKNNFSRDNSRKFLDDFSNKNNNNYFKKFEKGYNNVENNKLALSGERKVDSSNKKSDFFRIDPNNIDIKPLFYVDDSINRIEKFHLHSSKFRDKLNIFNNSNEQSPESIRRINASGDSCNNNNNNPKHDVEHSFNLNFMKEKINKKNIKEDELRNRHKIIKEISNIIFDLDKNISSINKLFA